MLDSVTVRAPGKVNLALGVGPLRADGYHGLVTVFQAVSIFDDLVATPLPFGSGTQLVITGEGAGVIPLGPDNLAARAVRALGAFGASPDVAIAIHKSIPLAGGMAGGSADAAAALVAVDALFELDLTRDELADVAATLGSDVPFVLHGGTAVGTNRGDQLTPALVRGSFHWVFAIADAGLSTPAVYAKCDQLRAGIEVADPEVPQALMAALIAGDQVALGRELRNDLQPAALALRPKLQRVLDIGDDFAVLGSVISGSGPTCAFLVRDGDEALDLAVALTSAGLCRTVKRATGPVSGAHIIDHRSAA